MKNTFKMSAALLCPEWLEEVLKVTGVVSLLALPSMNIVKRRWIGMGWMYLMIKKVLEKLIPQQFVETLMAHCRISCFLP